MKVERGMLGVPRPKLGLPAKRRRQRRPPPPPSVRELMAAWAAGARRQPCAVCDADPGTTLIRGHHILRQQDLRKIIAVDRLDHAAVMWDTRNRLPVCDLCHTRHHSRLRPITRTILAARAPRVFRFAAELNATILLEDQYPA